MNVQLELRTKQIIDKVEIFNKLNLEIKRFCLFNSFLVEYEFSDDREFMYFDANPMEGSKINDEKEKTMTFDIEFGDTLKINLTKAQEVSWTIKTLSRLIDRSNEVLKKAKELSKPELGILTYDEFSDTYFINKMTGEALLKSKEIQKTLSTTKLDIFGILLKLKQILMVKDYSIDILNISDTNTIKDLIKNMISEINIQAKKIQKYEGVPAWFMKFNEFEKGITISGFVSNSVDENEKVWYKINEFSDNVLFNDLISFENIYVVVRRAKAFNDEMMYLAKKLTNTNYVEIYKENKILNFFSLTDVGKELFDNLNILGIINEDLTNISFDFN